jgi:hypothetical protein
LSSGLGDHLRNLLHRSEIPAYLSGLLPETRDFRVRVRVDLIEFASCRVDYAGDLADDPRDRVI